MHHRMGWTHHEVGKVDVGRMALTLLTAKECGFSVAYSSKSPPAAATTSSPRGVDGGVFGGPALEAALPRCRDSGWDVGSDEAVFLPRPKGVLGTKDPARPSVASRRRGWTPVPLVITSTLPVEGVRVTKHGLPKGEAARAESPCWERKVVLDKASFQAGGDRSAVQQTAMNKTLWRGEDIMASEESGASTECLPAFCRVVIVGAGASGLSAGACVRAQGETDVLILER